MQFKDLGNHQPYQLIWQSMRDTIQQADLKNWQNQIWFVEHNPVFTQGEGGQQQPLINPDNIPIIATDRGGEITYHGPGQLMVYCLFNMRQLTISARSLIEAMEGWVIDYLASLDIQAHRKPNQPGVFINNHKVCSLGLRIRRGITYHGLALNVDMDLTPFQYINPCGYTNLQMTRLLDHCDDICVAHSKQFLKAHLQSTFSPLLSL